MTDKTDNTQKSSNISPELQKVVKQAYIKQFVLSTLLELKNEKKREALIKDLVKSDVLEYSIKNKIDLNNKKDLKRVKDFMQVKFQQHNDNITSLVINTQMQKAMKDGYKTLLTDIEFLEQLKKKKQKQQTLGKKWIITKK